MATVIKRIIAWLLHHQKLCMKRKKNHYLHYYVKTLVDSMADSSSISSEVLILSQKE